MGMDMSVSTTQSVNSDLRTWAINRFGDFSLLQFVDLFRDDIDADHVVAVLCKTSGNSFFAFNIRR